MGCPVHAMAPFARMAIVIDGRSSRPGSRCHSRLIGTAPLRTRMPHRRPSMAAALPALPMPAPLPGMALVAPVAVPVGLFG